MSKSNKKWNKNENENGEISFNRQSGVVDPKMPLTAQPLMPLISARLWQSSSWQSQMKSRNKACKAIIV